MYFQGATMDPLPIIQRLEDAFAGAGDYQQHSDDLEPVVETGFEVFR